MPGGRGYLISRSLILEFEFLERGSLLPLPFRRLKIA